MPAAARRAAGSTRGGRAGGASPSPSPPPQARTAAASSGDDRTDATGTSRSQTLTPPPPAAPASRLTKQYFEMLGSPPEEYPRLTVALTGAPCGSVLTGVERDGSANDSKGVVLEVVEGSVPASAVISSGVTEAQLVRGYVKAYGLSPSVAEAQVRGRQVGAAELDNAHPMGSGCPTASGVHGVYGDERVAVAARRGTDASGAGTRGLCECPPRARFRIVEPGVWADIADEFGNKPTLMGMVMAARVVTWREILQLFGNKSLMLRPRLFAVAVGPRMITAPDPSRAWSCVLRAASVEPTPAGPVPTTPAGDAGADGTPPPTTNTVTYEILRDATAASKRAASAAAAGAAAAAAELQITVNVPGAPLKSGEVEVCALVDAACGDLAWDGWDDTDADLDADMGIDDDDDDKEGKDSEGNEGAGDTALSRRRRALVKTYRALAPMTPGMLKAAMQKTVRYGACAVAVYDGAKVPAAIYAAMACAILATHPGGFVPQIQRVVRGVVSAFKRTAVIVLEDAFAGGAGDLPALLGNALVCQHVRAYHPPVELVRRCIRIVCEAVRSPRIINWRPHLPTSSTASAAGTCSLCTDGTRASAAALASTEQQRGVTRKRVAPAGAGSRGDPSAKRRKGGSGSPLEDRAIPTPENGDAAGDEAHPRATMMNGTAAMEISDADVVSFERAAILLRELRSFGGDLAMFDTVAHLAKAHRRDALVFRTLPQSPHTTAATTVVDDGGEGAPEQREPQRQCPAYLRPRVMPECHIVDQHAQRGIAHALYAPERTSFARRFTDVFEVVTGANPRLDYALAVAGDVGVVQGQQRQERRGIPRFIAATRFAQRCIMRFVQAEHFPRTPLRVLRTTSAKYKIDPGTLAAGVGPMAVDVKLPQRKKIAVYVVLPTMVAAERTPALGGTPSPALAPLASTATSEEHGSAGGGGPAGVAGMRARGGEGEGFEGQSIAATVSASSSPALSFPEEIVMLQPSRGATDDYLAWGRRDDPAEVAACDAEKAAARELARARPHPVCSPLLPSGKTATYDADAGVWCFDGRPWGSWVENGLSVEVAVHPTPYWARGVGAGEAAGQEQNDSHLPPRLLFDDGAIMEALCCTGKGMCDGARGLIHALAELASPAVVARARALVRQRFDRFSLPLPDLQGGLGLDQLQAYPNDWDVWRLLVLWSRVVPGALRPAVPPRFDVPSPTLLSTVATWLSEWRQERSERGVVATPAAAVNGWTQQAVWQKAYATAQTLLRTHQRDAVRRLRERQARGAPGHYLVMDTGHGKTLTALTYVMWRLLHTELGARVKRVLWVTPPGEKLDKNGKATDPRNYQLIQSLLDEFTPPEALVEVPIKFMDKKTTVFADYTVGILHQDNIRTMPEVLTRVAADSFIVFDEGDSFYGPSQRTSMALRLASLCPEFIIQTATPVPSRGKIERLAEWLGLTEEYPVTREDYLVAACNMVSLRVSLGIESQYTEHVLPRSPGADTAFQSYIRTRDWRALFKVLQSECDAGFCERAAHHARVDRTANPGGGCFVVCETDDHVRRLLALFRRLHPDVVCGDTRAMDDPSAAVVFVAAANNRGYNTGVRLGVQIRQPYPGSGAGRKQMEGRIRRLTQTRSKVRYEVVYMDGTLLQLLHERQQRDDSVNHSLEQLAEEYDRSVITFEGGGDPSAGAKAKPTPKATAKRKK